MKTIGLIGGMSWESTSEYYKIINEEVNKRLGGLHSAKLILYSVDFAEIERLQHQGDWSSLGEILSSAAVALEKAGVDGVILCTNTMHKLTEYITSVIKVPFLHIADATATKIKQHGVHKVGLLGTKFTMEQDFYKSRIINDFGIEVIIPNPDDCQLIHEIIYNELCLGIIKPESKLKYLEIINKLHNAGAEGIILGCTEIELLITQNDCTLPIYPTARIHAENVVEFMLS